MDRNNNNDNSGMADKVGKADEFHAKTSGKEYDSLMDAEFDALIEREKKDLSPEAFEKYNLKPCGVKQFDDIYDAWKKGEV